MHWCKGIQTVVSYHWWQGITMPRLCLLGLVTLQLTCPVDTELRVPH